MIAPPQSIKIGHLDYAICWVGLDWILANDRTGEISYVKEEIIIAESLSNVKKADTFLHEIMHALTHHYDRCSEEPIPRETVAEWVGAGLVMVWRDNPAAFEWWAGLLKPEGKEETDGR